MSQKNQNQQHQQQQKSTCQTEITPFQNPSVSSSYISYIHNQNNNIQTQQKNKLQFNNSNEGKLRLQSLAKQYELKLSKQKQFYDLRQYRLKQQINELQSKLYYHQNTSPQQILVQSSVSRHCQLCSNGQVIQHMKKMLQQAQKSHQGCLSNKRQLIGQYQLYRTRCGNYEFENERLKKQIDQLKQINSKINKNIENIQINNKQQKRLEKVQEQYHNLNQSNQTNYSQNQQRQQMKKNMSPIKKIQQDQYQNINKQQTYNQNKQQLQENKLQGNKYQNISYDENNIERRVVYISLEDQKLGKYDQIMNQFQERQKQKYSNIQNNTTSNIRRQFKNIAYPSQEQIQQYRHRQEYSNNTSLNKNKIQYQTRQAPSYMQQQLSKNQHQRNNQSMYEDIINPSYLNRQTNYEPIQYPNQYRNRHTSKQNTRRQSFSLHKQNQPTPNNPQKYNKKYEQLLAQKKSLSINLLNNDNIHKKQIRKKSFYERQPLQDHTSTINNTLGNNRFNFNENLTQKNYCNNDTFREKNINNPYKNSSQFQNFAYRY